MGKNKNVFERHEKKYMLTEMQFRQVYGGLADIAKPDEFGQYPICSIYYDTEDFRAIRLAEKKSSYKEKLRIRSYGIPSDDTKVYVELKKKFDGISYKRRVSLPFSVAEDWLEYGEVPNNKNQQIVNEIEWFLHRYNPQPVMLLSYDRIALCGRYDKNLRITFDKNVRFRDYDLTFRKGNSGTDILPANTYLMELKTSGPIPVEIANLLSRSEVYPVSFSKYRNAHFLMVNGEEHRNVG